MRKHCDNLFVLVSEDDSALRASRIIAGGVDRVGAAVVVELDQLGVTVLDLSEVDDSSSGSHSKFSGSPEVVQLIGQSLKKGHYNADARGPSLVETLQGIPILRDIVPAGLN
jgi:esterase/lipase superfamily enzyme